MNQHIHTRVQSHCDVSAQRWACDRYGPGGTWEVWSKLKDLSLDPF